MDHELILILALSLSLSLLRFMAALNQVDKDANAADMADEDPDQSRQWRESCYHPQNGSSSGFLGMEEQRDAFGSLDS